MSEHSQKAEQLYLSGYNCSQSVLGAFCDVTGIDFETSVKLASSFGGGMGRMREVCGACSGIFMAAGLIFGYSTPGDDELKGKHYALIQHLAGDFKEKFGTIICRELLSGLNVSSTPESSERTPEYYAKRPCVKFIAAAAELLDTLIENR